MSKRVFVTGRHQVRLVRGARLEGAIRHSAHFGVNLNANDVRVGASAFSHDSQADVLGDKLGPLHFKRAHMAAPIQALS